MPADTFSLTAGMFPAKLRVGLSATPERVDGKEIVLYAHIGPIRVKANDLPLTPRVLQVITNWLCPRVKKQTEDGEVKLIKLPHSPGKCGHMLKILAGNKQRNERLAQLIHACHAKGRRTIVFSDLLDHLDTFHQLLAPRLPAKDIGYYIGGMKEAELDKSKAKPVILATYKMCSEGTNIPWLDTCVLTTPHSDVRQVVGRVLREYPDKQQPLVIDPLDDDSPVFAGYGRTRRLWYRKIGAPVQTVS